VLASSAIFSVTTGYQVVPLRSASTQTNPFHDSFQERSESVPRVLPTSPAWNLELGDEPISSPWNKPNHLVGIIGGIGPAASIRFQERVLEKDRLKRLEKANDYCIGETCGFLADADYTPYLLYHNPRIPNNNLAVLGQGPTSVHALVDSAKALQRAGADEVAFCCTTAYHWKTAVEQYANIPVLDLLDQVAIKVADQGYTRVGLMDVDGTIKSGAFQKALRRRELEVVLPDAEDQQVLMTAVASLKSHGFSGNYAQIAKLHEVASHLAANEGKKVSAIILGCTEIAAALGGSGDEHEVDFIDTLDVLADCIVQHDQMVLDGLQSLPTSTTTSTPMSFPGIYTTEHDVAHT